ncbi:hypothetical protein AgCh_022190 [Apium graveolens]
MDVEANDRKQIMRGKRSKRSRLSTTTTSGSSSGRSFVGNSEEDEDMANCLIMLAQSGRFEDSKIKVEKLDDKAMKIIIINRIPSFICCVLVQCHRWWIVTTRTA